MNLIDVAKELATDEQCLAFLEKQRWPDGIVRCPTCGNDKISKITRKTQQEQTRSGLPVLRADLQGPILGHQWQHLP